MRVAEVGVLRSPGRDSPYGLCGRKAPLNDDLPAMTEYDLTRGLGDCARPFPAKDEHL